MLSILIHKLEWVSSCCMPNVVVAALHHHKLQSVCIYQSNATIGNVSQPHCNLWDASDTFKKLFTVMLLTVSDRVMMTKNSF